MMDDGDTESKAARVRGKGKEGNEMSRLNFGNGFLSPTAVQVFFRLSLRLS